MRVNDCLTILKDIKEHMQQDWDGPRRYDHAEIHIVGGEPTMLGLEYYQEMMPQARAILADIKQRVSFKIVSNLLDSASLDIASMFDEVCTSYEPETRFPKQRLHARWEERVRYLLDNKDIHLSATCTITKPTIEYGVSRLMDYLLSLGLRHIHMGFFIPSGDGLVNQLLVFPSFEETADYLIELTDWYLSNEARSNGLLINPVESLINGMYYNEPVDDIVCPIIPGSLDFDWDGNTVTCIEKGGEIEVDWIGNVLQTPIIDILASGSYQKARLAATTLRGPCRGCDVYTVCRAACGVLHQYWDGAGECPGFKKWLLHIQALVDNGVRPVQLQEQSRVRA